MVLRTEYFTGLTRANVSAESAPMGRPTRLSCFGHRYCELLFILGKVDCLLKHLILGRYACELGVESLRRLQQTVNILGEIVVSLMVTEAAFAKLISLLFADPFAFSGYLGKYR